MELHHQRWSPRASIYPWRLSAIASLGDRPIIPDPYRAHGHWALSARSALDSGRSVKRRGGQHAARSRHTTRRHQPDIDQLGSGGWRVRSAAFNTPGDVTFQRVDRGYRITTT